MSRKSTLILAAIAIASAAVGMGVLYLRPRAFEEKTQEPNRIVITSLPSQNNNDTPAISSGGKSMTMVFTSSKHEYSGLWTYLVYEDAFERMGLELVFENYPPERCSFLSDHGKVDGELSRVHGYNLTHPNLVRVEESVSSISWTAYTVNPAIHVDGWESLRGSRYKVEYRKGLARAEYQLYELLSEEYVSSVRSVSQGLRKLVAGRTDIYVDIRETVASYLANDEFLLKHILSAGLLEEVSLHAFFHHKNASYVSALSATLKEMREDGSLDRYILAAEQQLGAPSTSSRLHNAGFEEASDGTPEYWRLIGPEDAVRIDSDIRATGQQSMQLFLQQHSSDATGLQQEVDVEAGKRYDFGGSMKTSLQDGSARLSVTFLNISGNEIETHSLPEFVDDTPWEYRNMWILSPNGADSARILCSAQGRGQVWFDDIHFTPKIRGGY